MTVYFQKNKKRNFERRRPLSDENRIPYIREISTAPLRNTAFLKCENYETGGKRYSVRTKKASEHVR